MPQLPCFQAPSRCWILWLVPATNTAYLTTFSADSFVPTLYINDQHLVQCSESLVSLVSSNPLHRLKYIHVRDIGLKLAQEMDANRSRIFFSRLVCYRLKFKLQNALASSGAVFSACSPFSISLTSDKWTNLEAGLVKSGQCSGASWTCEVSGTTTN